MMTHTQFTRLFLFVASILVCICTDAQTDMTTRIENNSFEKNGLSGWDNSGFWQQTNTATQTQGWSKTGSSYAETWVAPPASVDDAWLMQNIRELDSGLYTVKVNAHAVLEGNASAPILGVTLNIGVQSIPITRGQEYTAWAIVLNGHLKLGIKVNATNANWVACDRFRLTKSDYTEEQVADYARLIYQTAVEDTLNSNRQAFFNHEQMRDATKLYTMAGNDTNGLLMAIAGIENAKERFDSIKTAYTNLRNEVNDFYTEISRTGFAAVDSVRAIRSSITRYYRRDEDHYDWVVQSLAALDQFRTAYKAFVHIGKSVNTARTQLVRTGYEGNEDFQQVIDEVANNRLKTYDINDFAQLEEQIAKAQQDYLKQRPSEWVTIINGNMLRERNGDVQAHAPGFVRVGDLWYMVGEDRTRSPDVNLYSSIDLVHWNFEKKIIENGKTSTALGSSRMIERPKLLYNPRTEKFVVWCHWEQADYGASEAACFYSDEVNGEYKQTFAGRPLGIKSRDCNVFVDDDGTAYFISTTEDNNHLGLFQLSDDYLSVIDHTQLFAWQGREAPAVVKIGGIYYMFSSACSGWEPNQCKLATSRNLRFGWSELRNVGNDIAFDTQPAAILEIRGTKANTYLYVGDRWQDPGLPESKTIMFPVTFNGIQCDFRYRERFDVNFVTGEWRETPVENIFLDKATWKINSFSSEEKQGENGLAANLIDDNTATLWHTNYTEGVTPPPHHVSVDLGQNANLQGFLAIPRTDAIFSGLIRQLSVSVSNDGLNWTTVYTTGWLPYYTTIGFEPHTARYVRLTSSDPFISLAELELAGTYDETNAIDLPEADAQTSPTVVSTTYYTLDGRALKAPLTKGVTIYVRHYDNNTSSTGKIRH